MHLGSRTRWICQACQYGLRKPVHSIFKSRYFSAIPSKRVEQSVEDVSIVDKTRNIGIIAHIDAVSFVKRVMLHRVEFGVGQNNYDRAHALL